MQFKNLNIFAQNLDALWGKWLYWFGNGKHT